LAAKIHLKKKRNREKKKKQLQNCLSPACVATGWDKKIMPRRVFNFLNDFVTRF